MRIRLTSVVVVLAIGLGACSALPDFLRPRSPHPHQALLDELDRNIATWTAARISRYAFTYQRSCFCDNTPHLVVGDGAAVRIDGVAVDPSETEHEWTPVGVPGLFAVVRRAIDGDKVTVTYDPATGVPLAMDSDPMQNAIDDELSFRVEGWTLDPPDDSLLGRVTAARALWSAKQVARYTMTVRITCVNCAMDGRIYTAVVRDGDAVVTRDGKRIPLDDPELEGVPVRVESLFDIATWAVTHASTTVAFDPDLGYPTRIATEPDPIGEASDGTYEVIRFTIP